MDPTSGRPQKCYLRYGHTRSPPISHSHPLPSAQGSIPGWLLTCCICRWFPVAQPPWLVPIPTFLAMYQKSYNIYSKCSMSQLHTVNQPHQNILALDLTTYFFIYFLKCNPTISDGSISVKLGLVPNHEMERVRGAVLMKEGPKCAS